MDKTGAIHNRATGPVVLLGVCLFILYTTISVLSGAITYDIHPRLVPVALFIFLAMLCGVITVYVFHRLSRHIPLGVIFTAGLVFRLVMVPAAPILEDDWLRYLWEGALTAHGHNPAEAAPADAYPPSLSPAFQIPIDDEERAALRALSAHNDDFAVEVAYPYLTTIYPGAAQAVFALAHMIKPFSLETWRVVLITADSIVFLLIVRLLERTGTDRRRVLLYWWHPLPIICGINAGHMDILLGPPLLLAVLTALNGRAILSGLSLGLAVGVKLWPLVLAPLIFRRLVMKAGNRISLPRLAAIALAFGVACLAASAYLCADLALASVDAASGLSAYAQSWQKNSLFFPVLDAVLSVIPGLPEISSRLAVAGIIATLVLALAFRRSADDASKTVTACLIIVGVMILLAPAGYPWYGLWFLFFLPAIPVAALSALSITLFLYYLRFPLDLMDRQEIFNFVIIPIEFLLPLLFFFVDRLSLQRSNRL